MKNPNQHNQSCVFGEQLVDYLYGEIGHQQQIEFERHLSLCAVCPAEMAAFSEMRFAVGDWKTEFDRMETPLIEIPYEKSPKTVEIGTRRPGIFESLRGLFTNFPTWATAAGSFAVLAVCAGLAIYLLSSEKTEFVAETNLNKSVSASPTPTPTNANQNINQPDEKKPVEKQNQPEIAKSTDSDKPQVVKTSTNNKQTVKNDSSNKSNQRKNTDGNRSNRQNRNSSPSLTGDEEEEDETLRLADLFEEIGTDE